MSRTHRTPCAGGEALKIFVMCGALSAFVPAPQAAAQTPAASPSAQCHEAGAEFAVGHRYSKWLARRARRAAHASAVRVLRPGEMHTMDFVETRLNLNLDEHGNVSFVKCG